MTYRCQLKSILQAKLFTKILESEYWTLKHSLIRKIESLCLRTFLWSFREISLLKEHYYVRHRKSWIDEGLDFQRKNCSDFMSIMNYSFHMP
uniref:Uncharacterized protein n=1 Tax=Onchocerca volvulus TaxID=6282 RepID=A0A8R1TUR1_ONCVO